jgi:hypothetical protein
MPPLTSLGQTWPRGPQKRTLLQQQQVWMTCLVHVADVCNMTKPQAQAAASAGRSMQGIKPQTQAAASAGQFMQGEKPVSGFYRWPSPGGQPCRTVLPGLACHTPNASLVFVQPYYGNDH